MDESAISVCAEAHHKNWLKSWREQGWTYGDIINGMTKRHTHLMDWRDLTKEQRKQGEAGVVAIFACLGIPDVGITIAKDVISNGFAARKEMLGTI